MIMTWVEAVKYLVSKGMKPVSESAFSDQNRVYFGFGSNEVFFNHSATVTEVGKNEFHVSDYSNLRKV